eukprot:1276755-Prymnesium_polylepis.2
MRARERRAIAHGDADTVALQHCDLLVQRFAVPHPTVDGNVKGLREPLQHLGGVQRDAVRSRPDRTTRRRSALVDEDDALPRGRGARVKSQPRQPKVHEPAPALWRVAARGAASDRAAGDAPVQRAVADKEVTVAGDVGSRREVGTDRRGDAVPVARRVAHQDTDVASEDAEDVHRVVDGIDVLAVHVADRIGPRADRRAVIRQLIDPSHICWDRCVHDLHLERNVVTSRVRNGPREEVGLNVRIDPRPRNQHCGPDVREGRLWRHPWLAMVLPLTCCPCRSCLAAHAAHNLRIVRRAHVAQILEEASALLCSELTP